MILFYFSSDVIVNQVLDELGLQISDELNGLPATGATFTAGKAKATSPIDPISAVDADLQARLDNLRRE